MKTWLIILIAILAIAVAGYIAKLLWQEWKEGRKSTPDDLLHDLNFKIEYTAIEDHNKLYLINLIKDLKNNPLIDQIRLNELDIKFRQRFQGLHEIYEHNSKI